MGFGSREDQYRLQPRGSPARAGDLCTSFNLSKSQFFHLYKEGIMPSSYCCYEAQIKVIRNCSD